MLKRFLPKTLFGRTFLIVVIPVLILQIAVSIVFFDRHWSKMTQRLALAVSGEINAIANQINQSDSDDDIQSIKKIANSYFDLSPQFKKREDANLPKRQGESYNNIIGDLKKTLSDSSEYPFQITIFEDDKRVVVDMILENGLLTIIVPEGRLFSSSSYIFILWMVALSILLFTIALIFMRNQIRPIYRLGLIAERLGRGIPVGQIKPTGAREVRLATKAFIDMQARLNQFLEQRTIMLAGVSHDLRTPLTRMKLQLAMMDDGDPSKATLHDDIVEMEHMIEGYLSFVKGDGGEEVQKVDIHSFLDRSIQKALRVTNIDIQDKRDKDAEGTLIWIKPQSMERVFDNLFNNAARYATQISIEVEKTDDFISIILIDNGGGIDEKIIDDIMKPFVREEKSRNQKTGGVGLGLTIANDIITSHGGHIILQNVKSPDGLRVMVTLPL